MNRRPSKSRSGYDAFSSEHTAHFTASAPDHSFFEPRRKSRPGRRALLLILLALLLILVCPLVKKKLKPKPERLNADRLAGQTAIVTEPIDAQLDTGAVKVSGVLWTAKCPSCARIETGAHVKILRVEGAKLLVEPFEVPVNIR